MIIFIWTFIYVVLSQTLFSGANLSDGHSVALSLCVYATHEHDTAESRHAQRLHWATRAEFMNNTFHCNNALKINQFANAEACKENPISDTSILHAQRKITRYANAKLSRHTVYNRINWFISLSKRPLTLEPNRFLFFFFVAELSIEKTFFSTGIHGTASSGRAQSATLFLNWLKPYPNYYTNEWQAQEIHKWPGIRERFYGSRRT